MPRTKSSDDYTQINLRMRTDTLSQIDEIAHKNCNDRSAEINRACAFWARAGGKPLDAQENMSELEQEIDLMKQSIDGLKEELRKLSSASEKDREITMKIIENLTALINNDSRNK